MLRKLLGRRWFGTAGDPVESALGVLERDVMDVLWADGDLAVRDVQARLPRRVAYTTVMTTLDRLYKKGVLLRRQSGRAFHYSAAVTRAELQAQIAGSVLAGLLQSRDGASTPVLSNLVESVGSQEDAAQLLRTLERLVRDKRMKIESGNAER